MADQIERQVIEIDNSKAKTAQKEVSDGWVVVERRADTAAKRVGSTVDQSSQDMVRSAETGRRTLSSIFDRIEAKARGLREWAGSAAKTTAELIIAWEAATMAASAFANRTKEVVAGHGEHVAAMGGLVNAYRSARIALSPTLFTALSIGAVAVIEKLGEMTYKTGALAEKAEVLSIKTKIAAYDLDVLGRAAKNVGGDTETLISATGKLIGAQDKLRALGVDTGGSLAQQFRDAVISIERIESPVQRIQATFDLFGTEVGEKMLPLLNGRLNDSISRVERLGAVLDPNGREAVLGFKNAVDQGIGSLKSMFEGVGDVASAIETRLASAIARGSRWIKDFSERTAKFNGGGGGPGIAPFIPVPDIDPAQFTREAQVIIRERLRAFGGGLPQTGGSMNAVSALDAQQREFDRTIEGIRHRIRAAEDVREKLRRSFGDANTSPADKERLLAPAILSQSRLIEDLKAQEAVIRAGEEAAKKAQAATERAQDILRNAQEAEQEGVLKIALRYQHLRQELGLTAEARKALSQAQALDIAREEKQIAREIEKLDREREQSTARRRTGFMVEAGRGRLAEFQFTQQTRELTQQNQEAQFSLEITRIEGLRDARLRAVDAVHAYTLRDQQAGNAQRASIEEQYLIDLLRLRTDAIDREATYRIEKIKEALTEEQLSSQEFLERQAAIRNGATLKARDLEIQTQSRIDEIRERAAIKQSELIIQRNERVFDSLKRQAEGVIDALITRTSSLGDAIKNIFKAALLTPLKDALSSRIAAFLTGQVTGVPVSLQSQGSLGAGQGRFSGALGGIMSTLGVGMAPVSRTTPPFVPGAVISHGEVTSTTTGGVLRGAGVGMGASVALSGIGNYFRALSPTNRGHEWATMAQGVLGGEPQRGGIMSMLPFGGFGGMRDFFGLGNSISTGAGSATTFGAASFGQKLSSLGKSDAAFMAGIGLGLDGWNRGGWVGAAEMGGSGAIIGNRFGGPVGAAIGAAIGFGVGAIKALRFKSTDQKIVDKVKQVYGLSIDKYFAKNTIWPIIQSEFGGNIDVGVRSEKIRNLLDTYGSMTNQAGKIQAIDNVARGVVLNQTGGRIMQDATWVNGTAYNYGGSTAGIGRSFAPNPALGGGVNVSIQLDGQATTSVMRGETVSTINRQPGLVASALQAANSGSMLRRDNAAGLFDPLAVTT